MANFLMHATIAALADADLVLRDIHPPTAPGWWPPAPGWWVLAAVLCLLLASAVLHHRRRRQKKRRAEAFFADALGESQGAQRVSAIATVLRQAARQQQPGAAALSGQAWRALLNAGGEPLPEALADLLCEGSYRKGAVDAGQLAQLEAWARRRFLRWLGVRP